MLVETLILLGCWAGIFAYGAMEQRNHFGRLRRISVRVHVNGIRGKSTVTRLLGAILMEAGLRTYTKTTGSAARIIFPDGSEKEILRDGPANLREQLAAVKLAEKDHADAMVLECMAINPIYQRISEEKMIQATVGVITNVREDHQDLMGHTLPEITESLCKMMPANGFMITAERNRELLAIIKRRAEQRKTTLLIAEELADQDRNVLEKFPYLMHDDNVAIGLAFARLMGIDADTAIKGMYKARPDPGVLRIYQKELKGRRYWFVNAHAINDRESIILTYGMLQEKGVLAPKRTRIAVLNNRVDRPTRVEQFVNIVAKDLKFDKVVLVGSYKDRAEKLLLANGMRQEDIVKLRNETLDEFFSQLHGISGKEAVIVGMVNIKNGLVQEYMKYFEEEGKAVPFYKAGG
ncbi:MAG: poly-gamma-glutamate synthase PgsB [Candidatus Micrarchaeia archaeon]